MAEKDVIEISVQTEEAVTLALSLLLDCATNAMQEGGKHGVNFPTSFGGVALDVTVQLSLPEITLPSGRVVSGVEILDVEPGTTWPNLGEGGVIRRLDGLFLITLSNKWVECPVFETIPHNSPAHVFGQKWLWPMGELPGAPEVGKKPVTGQTPYGPCPTGKSPCRMSEQDVKISPGVFKTRRGEGEPFHVCGDCLGELGGEAANSATSIP